VAFTEDLSVFFDPADFGDVATFAFGNVNGIFDKAYADPLGVEGHAPVFVCAESDLHNVVAGTPVTIRATSYKVAGPPQPDGTGIVLLKLQEQ